MYKRNKSAFLPEGEWAFHKVAEDQREFCLQYELKRGFDGLSSQKPWISLNPEEVQQYIKVQSFNLILPPVSDQHLAALMLNLDGKLKKSPNFDSKDLNSMLTTIFHIDWRQSNSVLKKRFDKFIVRVRSLPSPDCAGRGKPGPVLRGKKKRNRGVNRCLVDLALLRAVKAGFSRIKTVASLTPLLKAFELIDDESDGIDGTFSQKNWAATLKSSKASLKSLLK